MAEHWRIVTKGDQYWIIVSNPIKTRMNEWMNKRMSRMRICECQEAVHVHITTAINLLREIGNWKLWKRIRAGKKRFSCSQEVKMKVIKKGNEKLLVTYCDNWLYKTDFFLAKKVFAEKKRWRILKIEGASSNPDRVNKSSFCFLKPCSKTQPATLETLAIKGISCWCWSGGSGSGVCCLESIAAQNQMEMEKEFEVQSISYIVSQNTEQSFSAPLEASFVELMFGGQIAAHYCFSLFIFPGRFRIRIRASAVNERMDLKPRDNHRCLYQIEPGWCWPTF